MTSSERPTTPLGPVAVIIPTYNERDNLEQIVSRVRVAVPQADILVVDDNSPDGTGEIADKLAASDTRIHVMHRQGKSGLGAAYLAGLAVGYWNGRGDVERNWALDREFTPAMSLHERDQRYRQWQRAVERARDWEPH